MLHQCPACTAPVALHGSTGCTAPECGGDCPCALIDAAPVTSPADPDAEVYTALYGVRPGRWTTGLFSLAVEDRGDDETYLLLAEARWQADGRPPLPVAQATRIAS